MQEKEFQTDKKLPKSSDNGESEKNNLLPKSKLRRVLKFIESKLEQEICLRDLAAEAGLSHFYFARLFKQTTGKAPHQFVLEQRIDYAKYLLIETNEPLAQVALRCGWANQSHFTTAFKQKVGVTPRHYRHWHQPSATSNTDRQSSLLAVPA